MQSFTESPCWLTKLLNRFTYTVLVSMMNRTL
jgi:hypothetical protein